MTGRHLCRVRVFACTWLVSTIVIAPASAAGIVGCSGSQEPFAVAEASGARDALTIRLSDGREVRLAGVVAPTDSDGASESARRAAGALDGMVAGRRVALHGGADNFDRYGRLTAQVTIVGSDALWLQGELVLAGMVHAAPDSGPLDCAAALIGRETVARQRRAGLWREGTLAVRHASAVPLLLAGAGSFAVVEGTVFRIGEAGGRVFIDFGRRYSRDFSIIVPREAQAGFAKAGLDLHGLSGKRIRARGVLFEQGGPAMELRNPAALEVIGANGT